MWLLCSIVERSHVIKNLVLDEGKKLFLKSLLKKFYQTEPILRRLPRSASKKAAKFAARRGNGIMAKAGACRVSGPGLIPGSAKQKQAGHGSAWLLSKPWDAAYWVCTSSKAGFDSNFQAMDARDRFRSLEVTTTIRPDCTDREMQNCCNEG